MQGVEARSDSLGGEPADMHCRHDNVQNTVHHLNSDADRALF